MAGSKNPRPHDQQANPIAVDSDTTTRHQTPPPGPARGPHDVSFEIGACFVPPQTGLAGLDDAEKQVLAWMRENQADIARAERTFRVDRRAIAGAIAWEMLENVRTWSPRSVGPGKMHLYNYSASGAAAGLIFGGVGGAISGGLDFEHTLAAETEAAGYLPKQTPHDRKSLLATQSGAIRYIAASMSAISDLAVRYGFEDIRGNPIVLTNVYQSHTLSSWEKHLKEKKPGTKLSGGNKMDVWVAFHLAYLEDAVGPPQLSESKAAQ